MSVDATIEIPSGSNMRSRSRDSSIESRQEERLVRKRGNTQYLLKNMKGKCRVEEIENEIVEVKENFQWDYQIQLQEKKPFETKRKQWASFKSPMTKRVSPRDSFSIMTFGSLNNSIKMPSKCTI